MKKCNFFPVLLVALFMFLGFDSIAQNYQPIPEAIVLVSNAITSAQQHSESLSQTDRLNPTLSETLGLNAMKDRVGNALLEQLKMNVEVGKAIENVSTQFSVAPQRAQHKASTISFYQNLLKI